MEQWAHWTIRYYYMPTRSVQFMVWRNVVGIHYNENLGHTTTEMQQDHDHNSKSVYTCHGLHLKSVYTCHGLHGLHVKIN